MAKILYEIIIDIWVKESQKKPSSILHNNNIPEVGIPMLGNKK
jgi:hypothetical protein